MIPGEERTKNESAKKAWEEVPNPQLRADTDAVVRVDTVTICGTDRRPQGGPVENRGTEPVSRSTGPTTRRWPHH